MPTLVAVYLDFADADCHRVWRWLQHLPDELATLDVRPYSRASGEEPRNPWDRTGRSWPLELLALAEVARDRGRDCHLAFVDAAFRLIHERGEDLSAVEPWLELAASVDLDLDEFTRDSERWRAEVGLWHQEAEDEYDVRQVPSLVFAEDRALYVRLEEEIDDPDAGRRLLADLADLAAQPVEEVRRTP